MHEYGYCGTCGRALSDRYTIPCAGCTNIFDLPEGRRLHDPLTGESLFQSTGAGSMVKPEHLPVASAPKRKTLPRQDASIPWWTWVILILAIRGCWAFG